MVNGEEKIIETDLDTAVEDGNDNGSIYPYDLSDTVINMTESPSSVYEYLRKFDQKRINTQPDFQRNLVWTKGKKSKFIESIILDFPIPAIYLNETIDNTYIVIDGIQRTTALHDFYHNKFALTDLEALPRLIGKKFSDISPAMQAKFEDKKLNIYNLKPSTPMPVIYDLFNRINTGGTQLNKQEVRNCIFIGKSTRLLKELSEEQCFIEAIDGGIVGTRMKDRETVLRYIAFRWFDYKKDYYGANMSDYLEMAMKEINRMPDEKIEEIKTDFKRVMEWSFRIWGKKNFRIPTEHTRGSINSSILETVCNYLSYKTNDFLKQNLTGIKKNYFTLLKNSVYNDAVTKSTGNKTKVIERLRLTHEILDQNIINKPSYSGTSDVDEIQKQIDALINRKNSLQSSNSIALEKKANSLSDTISEQSKPAGATIPLTAELTAKIIEMAKYNIATSGKNKASIIEKQLGLTHGQVGSILFNNGLTQKR